MSGSAPAGRLAHLSYSDPEQEVNEAAADMLRNYVDMVVADTKGGTDKYFHCKANCEATTRGPHAKATAALISNLREVYGSAGGDPAEDRAADQVANRTGRIAASGPNFRGCEAACERFRPEALSSRYRSSR